MERGTSNSRAFVLLLLIISSRFPAFSQEISIDFSLSYIEGTPFLTITYTNNSEKDYYIPSLFSSYSDVPAFSSYPFSRFHPCQLSKEELNKRLSTYNNSNYSLPLEFSKQFSKSLWFTLQESESTSYSLDFLLASYYEPFERFSVYHKRDEVIDSPEFLRHTPALVFLKAFETKKQFVDFSAFRKAGVVLKVYLDNKRPPNLFEMTPGQWMQLPEDINGYAFYSQVVYCKERVLDFGESFISNDASEANIAKRSKKSIKVLHDKDKLPSEALYLESLTLPYNSSFPKLAKRISSRQAIRLIKQEAVKCGGDYLLITSQKSKTKSLYMDVSIYKSLPR